MREVGVSPAKAVERLRLEAARERVEHSREPIERIAAATGFHDPERMRRAFIDTSASHRGDAAAARLTPDQSGLVKSRRKASSHRRCPSSVSATDFALLTGSRIMPLSCSRSSDDQPDDFHARQGTPGRSP